MLLSLFRHIFFPPVCVACDQSIATGTLCSSCRSGMAFNRTVFCGTCRARLPEGRKVCHLNSLYLLGAAGNYEDQRLRSLIHALKFRRLREAAITIADILAEYVVSLKLDLRPFAIIPLPLSKERKRQRGFNQTELIGRALSSRLHIPLQKDVLIRTRHSPPQSETKSFRERQKNVLGAFAIHQVSGALFRNIILLDDVTTSGSTFREAASALKHAGVKKIFALAVAKA